MVLQTTSNDGQESAPDETQSTTDSLGIDSRYTVLPEVDAQGHLGKVADPFIEMRYPLNRDSDLDEGVIRNSNRWQAVQRPDGSGVVESSQGGVTYGIRLADGTILGNEETGFWFPYRSEYHQRRPDDSGEVDRYDYEWFIQFPYLFVGQVLTELTTLDMGPEESMLRLGTPGETFVDGATFMRGVVAADIREPVAAESGANAERGVLLEHRTGAQVYIGRDSTAKDGFELFGFVPFDGETGTPAPSARDALDLLRPEEAAAAADSGVVRQGEWFFVPTTDRAEGSVQKPGVAARPFGASPLDAHVPRDWRTVVPDEVFVKRVRRAFAGRVHAATLDDCTTPQSCVDALTAAPMLADDDEVYAELRDLAGGIQVRGSIRHRENEHSLTMADGWRQPMTHGWDVLSQDGETFRLD